MSLFRTLGDKIYNGTADEVDEERFSAICEDVTNKYKDIISKMVTDFNALKEENEEVMQFLGISVVMATSRKADDKPRLDCLICCGEAQSIMTNLNWLVASFKE